MHYMFGCPEFSDVIAEVIVRFITKVVSFLCVPDAQDNLSVY